MTICQNCGNDEARFEVCTDCIAAICTAEEAAGVIAGCLGGPPADYLWIGERIVNLGATQ